MATSIEATRFDRSGSMFSLRQLLIIVLGWGVLFGKWPFWATFISVVIAVVLFTKLVTTWLYRTVHAPTTAGVSLSFLTCLCWWVALCILSVGPAVAVCEARGVGHRLLDILYAPLAWLINNDTVLAGPLKWYIELCDDWTRLRYFS